MTNIFIITKIPLLVIMKKSQYFFLLLFLSNLILNLEDRSYIDTTRGVYQTTQITQPHPNRPKLPLKWSNRIAPHGVLQCVVS